MIDVYDNQSMAILSLIAPQSGHFAWAYVWAYAIIPLCLSLICCVVIMAIRDVAVRGIMTAGQVKIESFKRIDKHE